MVDYLYKYLTYMGMRVIYVVNCLYMPLLPSVLVLIALAMVIPHCFSALCLSSLLVTLLLCAAGVSSSSSANATKIGQGYRLIYIEKTPDGGLVGLLQVKQKTKIYGPDIPLLRFYAKYISPFTNFH